MSLDRGVLAVAISLALAVPAAAQRPPVTGLDPAAGSKPPTLERVGFDQRIGKSVPLDLAFRDEAGRRVVLGDYFGERPVALSLVYFECPMLCPMTMDGLARSLKGIAFDAGREFEVVVVSFDPGETPGMARAKRDDFLRRYGRDGAEVGVHFLTGRESSIAALADAIGFRYAYDPAIDQWAHPAVVTILTPQGAVSRYLFGIEYAPRDLRLALIEAAEERIGTVVDQALLFCYNYDPETGRYGFAIMTTVRVAGLLTVAGLGAFILTALRRDRRAGRAVKSAATGNR
jgi:protein SCO1/2